jgi:hypothetical protein
MAGWLWGLLLCWRVREPVDGEQVRYWRASAKLVCAMRMSLMVHEIDGHERIVTVERQRGLDGARISNARPGRDDIAICKLGKEGASPAHELFRNGGR